MAYRGEGTYGVPHHRQAWQLNLHQRPCCLVLVVHQHQSCNNAMLCVSANYSRKQVSSLLKSLIQHLAAGLLGVWGVYCLPQLVVLIKGNTFSTVGGLKSMMYCCVPTTSSLPCCQASSLVTLPGSKGLHGHTHFQEPW